MKCETCGVTINICGSPQFIEEHRKICLSCLAKEKTFTHNY